MIPLSLSKCNFILAVHICGNPENLIDNSVSILGYTEPAVEGTTVTFQCPPGAVLDGANSSTCTENGEWEPLPREIHCFGMPETNCCFHNLSHAHLYMYVSRPAAVHKASMGHEP